MRKLFVLIFMFLSLQSIYAQKSRSVKINGTVEYISSQFVYINFKNTNGINIGDTLFLKYRKRLRPKLIVKTKSSRSCAAIVIGKKVKKGMKVIAFIKNAKKENKSGIKKTEYVKIEKYSEDKTKIKKSSRIGKLKSIKSEFYGRFSLSGYSNISNIPGQQDYQHWRHSLSLYANNISGSKISLSSYVTFRYRADQWNLVQSNLGSALKFYDLAIKYQINSNANLLVGRKINRKLSNVGAIDGLQFETKVNNFFIGGILGSRPNFSDYGFNIKLLELGAYINRTDSVGNGQMSNTLSIMQQMNDFTTDRRFLYFQHSSNFIKNVYLFLSTEFDLFEHIHERSANKFSLTSLFLSLRYSPARWVTVSTSYDARRNVIYYETFKNYIDQLVENATRQGFRLRINLRPVRYVFASVYSGYRFRKSDIKPTRNFGGSVTYSRLPFVNASLNISYIKLITNYLDGNIIGVRLSKDIFNGLIYSTVGYRRVNYTFNNSAPDLLQDIFLVDLSLRVSRKISLSLSYEGTYQGITSYSNIFANITTRF